MKRLLRRDRRLHRALSRNIERHNRLRDKIDVNAAAIVRRKRHESIFAR